LREVDFLNLLIDSLLTPIAESTYYYQILLKSRDDRTGVHDGGTVPVTWKGGKRGRRCHCTTTSHVISGTLESGEMTGLFSPFPFKRGRRGRRCLFTTES